MPKTSNMEKMVKTVGVVCPGPIPIDIMEAVYIREGHDVREGALISQLMIDELGLNKDRYKSLADEMDSTFAELAGY